MANTALSTADKKVLSPIDEVKSTLSILEPELKKVLPSNIKPAHFTRVLLTAIQNDKKLIDANVDKGSLYRAALKCAADGLVPDGREAALVSYKGRVNYLPMVGGILKKIRNSGELGSITAHIVHEHDKFIWRMGDDEMIIHEVPPLGQDRGKAIGAYAIATMKDGFKYREVMSEAEILLVRAASPGASFADSPWVKWPHEQWKKTVIKRMSKRMPMSTDMADVIDREDDEVDTDEAPTMSSAPTPQESSPKPKSRMHEAIDADVVPASTQSKNSSPATTTAPDVAEIVGEAQDESTLDTEVPI